MDEQQNEKEKRQTREYIALLSISYGIRFSTTDTAIGIVTSYGLDDRGIEVCSSARKRHFSLLQRVMDGSWVHPVSWSVDIGSLLPWRQATGTSPTNALNNSTPTVPYAVISQCLTQHMTTCFILTAMSDFILQPL
jgi:hypothetical protein